MAEPVHCKLGVPTARECRSTHTQTNRLQSGKRDGQAREAAEGDEIVAPGGLVIQ